MYSPAPVNTLSYDAAQCVNCGMCIDVCPHAVFAPGEGAVVLAAQDACMECGACMVNCPTDAIYVDSDVGCAYALIRRALLGGGKEIGCCGPDDTEESACCS